VAFWLLAPPSWVYAAVQTMRRRLYRWGVLRSRRLFPAVVSIGGVRVGGSGKTPFTAWVAGRLRDKGYRVAVLTRGYGRRDRGESLILHGSDGGRWDPDLCGDEPCLLAASLGDVPVVVDACRYRGGVNALRFFPVDVFVLDDGFQHLALARDCDVVLVPDEEDSARAACLPRGPLREPVSALRDADIVVRVGPSRDSGLADRPRSWPRAVGPGAVYGARMDPGALRVLGEDVVLDPAGLQGERVFAISGIARPQGFQGSLERLGLRIQEHVTYPDHHRYTRQDHLALLDRLAGYQRAITTEKDAVKLARFPWPKDKLLVLGVRPVLLDEVAFWRVLEARLRRGAP